MIVSAAAPWNATLSEGEHALVQYILLFAVLAFFIGFARAWATKSEIGVRYRPAALALICLMAVAFIAYLFMLISFENGYDLTSEGYVPNADAIGSFAPRFTEWSVTVPLLVIEILAVTSLTDGRLLRIRVTAVTFAFLMIFCGYLGGVVLGNGEDVFQLVLWGSISTVFWIGVNIVLIRAVRLSYPDLTAPTWKNVKWATIVLLGGFAVYPFVYAIQIFGEGGGWTTTTQIAYTVTDVIVKLGFGGLIHRAAKLRTAEDVRMGKHVHPEAIWMSNQKLADAGTPREVYIAEDSIVHPPRTKPADSSAVAAEFEQDQTFLD